MAYQRPKKDKKDEKDKPDFKTLLSSPVALNANVMLEVRTTSYAGKERSGTFVALRKGFVGKGAPLESVTCGDDPDILDAIGESFKAHAKALRDRRATS